MVSLITTNNEAAEPGVLKYMYIDAGWYIHVSKSWDSNGSSSGLSPVRCKNIWTSDGLVLIGSFGTYFSEVVIKLQ